MLLRSPVVGLTSPEKVARPTRTRRGSRPWSSERAARISACKMVSPGSVLKTSGAKAPGGSSSLRGFTPTCPSRSTSAPLATLVESETSITSITSNRSGPSLSARRAALDARLMQVVAELSARRRRRDGDTHVAGTGGRDARGQPERRDPAEEPRAPARPQDASSPAARRSAALASADSDVPRSRRGGSAGGRPPSSSSRAAASRRGQPR